MIPYRLRQRAYIPSDGSIPHEYFLIGVADVFMITLFMFVCCVGMRMQFMDILVAVFVPNGRCCWNLLCHVKQ